MVDPSLFTAPYDARLSEGLAEAGIAATWATRRLRKGEEDELGGQERLPFFYPWTDGDRRRVGRGARLLKGVEHAMGLRKLVSVAAARRFPLVHFQWLLVPALDRLAIQRLRIRRPVVITVHDSEPFNGKSVNRAQRAGFDAALALADRLITHTASARQTLVARGIDAARIAMVPHGRLGHDAVRGPGPARAVDRRWTIVQFGKMQGYKGIDLLIEALGSLSPATRSILRVVIAGEALIDLAPIRLRAAALGITSGTLEWRTGYLSSSALDALIEEADTFVFPYRAIEASGALLLVAGARKWIVASRLGLFAELIGEEDDAGELVEPGNVAALAAALVRSVARTPKRTLAAAIPDWTTIGRMTAQVYQDAVKAWSGSRVQVGASSCVAS